MTSIAAAVNKVAGKDERARYWLHQTLARRPDASITQFFAALPIHDPAVRTDMHLALKELGMREV